MSSGGRAPRDTSRASAIDELLEQLSPPAAPATAPACLRHTRDPLDLPAAAVLHRALTCSREDRARDALRLLEDDHGVLRPTPPGRSDIPGSP